MKDGKAVSANLKSNRAVMIEECSDGFKVLMNVNRRELVCVVSWGLGWEHVSVSVHGKKNLCPTWEDMCFIKNTFWDDEEVVMQLHPARSEYVDVRRGCLHLWKPVEGEIPKPPKELVG